MTNDDSVYLIDTNVVVYAYDERYPAKQDRAIDILRALEKSGFGTLTTQVLSEFYVNVTRKPLNPLRPDEAQRSCEHFVRSWPVLSVTPQVHLMALHGVRAHVLSYWDAVLWATAMENDVPFILTEDQQHNRLVGNVRYLNPFLEDFDLAILS